MQTLEAEVVDEKLEVDFAVDHEEMVVHLMQSCKTHLDVSIENRVGNPGICFEIPLSPYVLS